MQNYAFFGAPAGLFFSLDWRFDKGQWAHLGVFMQSIALAAMDKGLAICMQEAWSARAATVTKFLGLEENQPLYCGIAMGYADRRAPVDQFATFIKE